ncbi:hypothetical protein NPIL_190121 [Nephila pilipes]|uniref:Uncharacterized protein n=1 Tax=Nephila pilipes TaxID=299642 RepID=A0A8X6R0A0_NEPPI|nr:hypothetical protein NPIL_190121 [Nephila pilipes]
MASSSDKDDGNTPRGTRTRSERMSMASTLEEIPEAGDVVNEDTSDVTTANIQFIRYLNSRFEEYGNLASVPEIPAKQHSPLSHGRAILKQGYLDRDLTPQAARNEVFDPRLGRNLSAGRSVSFLRAGPSTLKYKHQVSKSIQTEPMVEESLQPWLIRAKNSADRLCTELENCFNIWFHSPENLTQIEEIIVTHVGYTTDSETAPSDGEDSQSDDANKFKEETIKKLLSVLVSAEHLRNSLPTPLNNENNTSLGLEISDEDNKRAVQREYDKYMWRLENTTTSSTQTDYSGEIAPKNTGAIPKQMDRSYKKCQNKKKGSSRTSDKPSSKSMSFPTIGTPAQKTSSSKIENSEPPSSVNNQSRENFQNELKDEAKKTGPVSYSISRLKRSPRTDPEEHAASRTPRTVPEEHVASRMPRTVPEEHTASRMPRMDPETHAASKDPQADSMEAVGSRTRQSNRRKQAIKTDKASSSIAKTESDNATTGQGRKNRSARVSKREDAINLN